MKNIIKKSTKDKKEKSTKKGWEMKNTTKRMKRKNSITSILTKVSEISFFAKNATPIWTNSDWYNVFSTDISRSACFAVAGYRYSLHFLGKWVYDIASSRLAFSLQYSWHHHDLCALGERMCLVCCKSLVVIMIHSKALFREKC